MMNEITFSENGFTETGLFYKLSEYQRILISSHCQSIDFLDSFSCTFLVKTQIIDYMNVYKKYFHVCNEARTCATRAICIMHTQSSRFFSSFQEMRDALSRHSLTLIIEFCDNFAIACPLIRKSPKFYLNNNQLCLWTKYQIVGYFSPELAPNKLVPKITSYVLPIP
jgi:hypothetical protein